MKNKNKETKKKNNTQLTRNRLEILIRELLKKYNGESAILFGSYARGDYTDKSDVDVVVFGGDQFKPIDIFAFGEDLREMTKKEADVFEIREINKDTEFYKNVLKDGVHIS